MEVFQHIKKRMTCKGHYHVSIVLAFSCGRHKTIRMKYVGTRISFENGKNFSFSKISGYVWTRP